MNNLSGDETKKIIRKKKAQPKLRSQKKRPVKARAKKVIFRNSKSAIKRPKKAAARHSVPAVFRSHASRVHAAIRRFGTGLIEKHRAVRSKLLRHVQKNLQYKHNSAVSSVSSAHSAKKNVAPQKGVLLLNMTKNYLISNKVVFANTPFEKFRGLMFRNRKDVNYALVFDFKKALKDSAAIHMFFVFFPIDVVYLRDSKVVDLHRAVKPFTAYLAPKTRADTLIELPQGTIWKSGISIGDEILTTSG